MTGGYTMKEKNIRELAKRMGLVTVEDMCQYTIAQLVVKIANKVNELVDEVWRFETDVQEILKTQNENIQYLLGEGLHLEIENIFDGWLQDGTFDSLINHSALKKVNDRIDETNTQLTEINNHVTEIVNVKNYGVDSTGVTDCTNIIQGLIDDGYSLYFPSGRYRLNIHLKTGITLQGEGLALVTLLANDMNQPVIKTTRQDYGYEIKDLTIDGRNEMGKGSTTGHGIHLTNEGELAVQDLEPLIENVKIINVHTGLKVDATVRGGLFKNIKAGACKIGINHQSTDCIFKDCITAQTQSHGIYNLQGNNTFISCKAFLAGLNKSEGAGMKNQGSFNRIINCEFQQNVLENLHLQNANYNIIQGCVLDGAGYGSKNYFPSLQYTENGGGVVPLSNLRMYNSNGNIIDCTIINGRLDSYAKTGFYNQYVGKDKDNFIRLAITDTSSDGVMTDFQFDDVDKYTQNNEIYINSKKLYSKKMNTVTAIDNQVEILSGGYMEVNGMVFVNIEFKCLKTQSWGSEIIQGLPRVRFNTPLSCNRVDKTLSILTSGKITINPSMTENEIIRVSGFYLLN